MDSTGIKNIILNIKKPHVLKNLPLDWNCFSTTIEEFCSAFNDDNRHSNGVVFEFADLMNDKYPQFERNRHDLKIKLSDFLIRFKNGGEMNSDNKFASFSYKDLTELPLKCREGISYSKLGFEEVQDISFWLGSQGAHTSCHYDTYGCNIVVQVYGRYEIIIYSFKQTF